MSFLINPYRFGAPLLLDLYSGATAAYSLRLLRNAYTGPVVRVRRSSDNTEQDFTATQVTDGTLTTFCGSGNGFVRTWYDQVSTANLGQSTTANQPQIVSNGVVLLLSNKPTMLFDGINDRLINNGLSISQPVSAFALCNQANSGTDNNNIAFDSYNNAQFAFGYEGDVTVNTWRIAAGTAVIPSSPTATTSARIFSMLFSGSSSYLYANDSSVFTSQNIGTNGLSGLSVGDIRGNPSPIITGYEFNGRVSELIFYGLDQSTNRTNIRDNMNAHYAIF